MRKIITVFALMCLPVTANAYESTLPQGAVLCGTRSSMDEAVQAVDRRDEQWFRSLPMCLFTNQPVKAQRLECEGRICKVRFWAQGASAVGYVLRTSLSH